MHTKDYLNGRIQALFTIFLAILLFAELFTGQGCKKESETIPNVYVDFYIYLNQPSYAALNSVGNFVYVTGGVKGIIVYRKSLDEFVAYDRSCPYDPDAGNAIINVDSTNVFSSDSNCGSKFNLLDGSVLNGPATRPLKSYRTSFDGLNTLHIFN